MMLSLKGVPFEDFRYPTHNESGEMDIKEMKADKAKGLFVANLDRLPILNIDGVEIGQSKAIDRYVAKLCGYLGENSVDAAMTESIVETITDIKKSYMDVKRGKKDEELKEAKTKFVKDTEEGSLFSWLQKLDKTISGESGFSVGKQLSYADFHLYDLLKDYFDDREAVVETTVKAAPKINAIVANVEVALSDYLSKRPQTKF